MEQRAPFRRDVVSVVTPVYNGAEFLAKMLNSVLAQSWQQIEMILAQRAENIETEAGNGVEMERPPRVMPENEGHFEIGAEINGDRDELPL